MGFSIWGLQALEHWLSSCSEVCGIFLDQGSNLCPSHCKVDFNHWTTRETPVCLFVLLQKAFLFPLGPRHERGLQGVKSLRSGCREGLQAALILGATSKATGPQRLLVVLEGEPFE